jgi:hypothetical protein
MGFTSFKTFQDLLSINHFPKRMGLKCTAGDINRLNSRMRLARSFQGILLEGYNEKTISGYNALFQVFLTHSVLEQYCHVFGHRLDRLAPVMAPYAPETVITTFRDSDPEQRFYKFLHERVNNYLKQHLINCFNGSDANVGHLSASIRHIFAHGHLTAHANNVNPDHVNLVCACISDFLLNFMDAEFTKFFEEYCIAKDLEV